MSMCMCMDGWVGGFMWSWLHEYSIYCTINNTYHSWSTYIKSYMWQSWCVLPYWSESIFWLLSHILRYDIIMVIIIIINNICIIIIIVIIIYSFICVLFMMTNEFEVKCIRPGLSCDVWWVVNKPWLSKLYLWWFAFGTQTKRTLFKETFHSQIHSVYWVEQYLWCNHWWCVTHVPWCMSGTLTSGGGENVPGIPGAYETRNFAHLLREPLGNIHWRHRDSSTETEMPLHLAT